MPLSLATPVNELNLIGPAYAKRLKKLEITSLKDLLYHIPHRYLDLAHSKIIGSLTPGETVTVKAQILSCKNLYTKRGKIIQKAIVRDPSGQLELTWFNQTYIPNSLTGESLISVAGKVSGSTGKPEMISPDFELLKYQNQNTIHTGRLVPVYPETYGVSSKWLRSRIHPLISQIEKLVTDYLPDAIRKKEKLPTLTKTLQTIHFPASLSESREAKNRLAFDELFLLQLKNEALKTDWKNNASALKLKAESNDLNRFLKNLPFKLTPDQTNCIREIKKDLGSVKPMNRLLLGDVGSGKTVVAAAAVFISHLNHTASAVMAPTEILARQHYDAFNQFLSPYQVKIALHTGSRKAKNQKYDLVIGTQALLYHTLKKHNFSLIVIDEQHRFGVKQRSQLIKKGGTPHVLTMTATPIPRTVALTLYGNLDLSTINQMPPGRQTIKTWLVPPQKREAAYQWIKKYLDQNQQAFIICPLIEASRHETLKQIKAASREYERLQHEVFSPYKLGLLHGNLKPKAKDEIINRFRKKKLDILVSTPVVEVGIDIPNASIMVIEGAERFGLAQLHQLRGRVGRREQKSYCLLFTGTRKSSVNKRLKAMEKEASGSKLAEIDLQLRGPGEIYGTHQHGFKTLKFAELTNAELIIKTKNYTRQIINQDPTLAGHKFLKAEIDSAVLDIKPS